MKINNFYHYLFFIYYSASEKSTFTWGAVFYGAGLISGIFMFIFSIIFFLGIIFLEPIRLFMKQNKGFNPSVIFFFICVVINNIYFFRNKKYALIIDYYRNELGLKKGFWLYFKGYVIPAVLFIIMFLIAHYIRINRLTIGDS